MIAQLSNIAQASAVRLKGLTSLSSTPAIAAFWTILAFGVATRLSPLTDPDGRLLWQFMTEDGYLMQTAARNFALGLGLSTAEGTIPTNGVQPLATFVFAFMHFLSGGSKAGGVALVTVLSTMVAIASGLLLYRAMKRFFAPLAVANELAAGGAVLWFSAPIIIGHTMNGLETGFYYFFMLATLNYYLSIVSGAIGWRARLLLGVLLGLTFLARNDAVFFIAALLLTHLAIGPKDAASLRKRFADCILAGLVSMIVASPWLINNYVFFGSLMPISGIAVSHNATLGINLPWIAANIFQATTLFAPIPQRLESNVIVIAGSLASVVFVAIASWLAIGSRTDVARRVYLIGALFTLCIAVYYGLFFGASHFVPRYVSALSPFLWTAAIAAAAGVAGRLLDRAAARRARAIAAACMMICGAIAAAFSAHMVLSGESHGHKQIVDWVRENVREDQWVGAIQTGALGYFHDRTINLDGKVNPMALEAILERGHVLDYALQSDIEYLADWNGVIGWKENARSAEFSEAFEVLVDDPQANIGVLKRISAPGDG